MAPKAVESQLKFCQIKASAHLKNESLQKKYPKHLISHHNIHVVTNRAKPIMMSNFKLSLQSFQTFNDAIILFGEWSIKYQSNQYDNRIRTYAGEMGTHTESGNKIT